MGDPAPAYAASVWRNVVVSVWARGGNEAEVRELLGRITTTAEAHEGRAGALMVILEHCSLPSTDARKAAGEFIRVPGRIAHMAIVVEGGGFWASAMRSVFSLLGLVYRPQGPWKMVQSVEEALAWQSEHLVDGEESEDALRRLIGDLRRQLT